MIVSRIHPRPSRTVDLEETGSREALLEWYRPASPSAVRINLIASVSGALGGSDGTSHTLSSTVDRRILGVIRELADVVLVGAESVRREGYVVPKVARLAIVTSSGDLTGHAIDAGLSTGRVLVLTKAGSTDRVHETLGAPVDVVELPSSSGRITAEDLLSALRARGLESIVCEGGPRLAGHLLDAGVVDELCLSTSPLVSGGAVPVLASTIATQRTATLAQLLLDDASGLYARWALR